MGKYLIFHGVAIFHYVFSLWYDQEYVNDKHLSIQFSMSVMKGRLKFLTLWNMLLQATFFTICFLNDIIGTNEETPRKPPLIRKVKDLLLPCLAFPISMFVGTTFWGLYAIDRELVFPKVLDEFFPVWLNHVMHTNIMIFILIELFTSYRLYPTRKVGFTILLTFMATYLVWIHVIHAYSGMWVYPVLQVLNLPMRVVFFVFMLGFVLFLYLIGEKLNTLIWDEYMAKRHKVQYSKAK